MAQRMDPDIQPTLEAALAVLARAVAAPMACLHLADDEAGVLAMVTSHDLTPVWTRAWARLGLDGSSLPARVNLGGQAAEVSGEQAPGGLATAACAPIKGAEITVGTLTLLWPSPQAPDPDPDRLDFLETAGHLLGLTIEHAGLVSELMANLDEVRLLQQAQERKNRELDDLNKTLRDVNELLAELSTTDELTGAFNRRHLMDRLSHEVQRSRRQGQPLCLVIADLDHFKRVNDTLGHQAGDQALKVFAATMRKTVREVDVVGRYGGEEFMLVLLDCNLEAGLKVAEKLRTAVSQALAGPPFDVLGGVTVSLGVSQLREEDLPENLIARADQALYAAKEWGRNRVEKV